MAGDCDDDEHVGRVNIMTKNGVAGTNVSRPTTSAPDK
jgi:hypothetical protein